MIISFQLRKPEYLLCLCPEIFTLKYHIHLKQYVLADVPEQSTGESTYPHIWVLMDMWKVAAINICPEFVPFCYSKEQIKKE